jgi:hypothetical protein
VSDAGTPAAVANTAGSPASVAGAGDTTTVLLSIGPKTNTTFSIGEHKVQIVAGSICDPATAGYGPALWDAPCQPSKETVLVTAKAYTSAEGRPVLTFTPDLRFVPGRTNKIWLLDPAAASRQAGVLAWCPTGGAACVDEGATDASLATDYTGQGYAHRRIKHFSGYTVVANRKGGRAE